MRRNPIFIFAPAMVMLIFGLSLISQPQAFGKQHEIIKEQILRTEAKTSIVQAQSFDSFLYQRFLTDIAGSEAVVVNKLRPLNPLDFAPLEMRELKSSESLENPRSLKMVATAATALEALANEMFLAKAGQLFMNSGYRSYDYQLELFESKTEQYGLAGALIRSAKAGHSEHQTGLTMDVSVQAQGCAIMQCFGETKGGKWLADNAWQFGFIVRYEDGTQAVTGYTYEPWHLRFVGKNIAKLYHEGDFSTLEEFWGYPAAEFYEEEITESTID
ncbi:D-alanyl-D-alanine carboxypeptidase family protein [Candidatus Aquiluna sp. UB-MaderosW2red]|uniref:M15 family metallopeptidase n=1 Tax=Candidatus Aquiluna sp. UB-MaderosW2red TaxID=1855377 RepID=UPI000B82D5D3|nr:M15 family metallopeptidase [Candidatus Aquiluna sp. UB-MaderosW2red]